MKQIWTYSFLVIFIFSCQSKEKEFGKGSEIFILSEYSKKGRIDVKTMPDSIEVEVTSSTFNPDYIMGNVHFLILNENQAFYSQYSPLPFGDCLAGTQEDLKNDSIKAIQFNIEAMNRIRPITIDSIREVIKIANNKLNQKSFEKNIFSFALKDDTLRVDFFSELVKQLENDDKNRILIRRMNDKELETVENYSE